jgi:hypothetical protein
MIESLTIMIVYRFKVTFLKESNGKKLNLHEKRRDEDSL